MFQYEDLMWLISFPLVCAVMLWFSLDLAVLVRVGGGRRRRANARRAIERRIMNSPVCGMTSSTGTVTASAPPPQDRGGDDLARPSGSAADSPHTHLPLQQYQKVQAVAVPAALRIATRAVVRRAVVMVGGDFARSPRMQYHAASLARSGLFDEVLLVGLDCGNQLSEDLLISGEPLAEHFVIPDEAAAAAGVEQANYAMEKQLRSPEIHAGHGCIVSTRYLAHPPSPPEWFQAVFPLRSLHWVVCTLYRVVALSLMFIVQTGRAATTRINEHGQLLVTDLIMIQTPPAIPFVLLVKYIVCPLAFLYNVLLYYCVVIPASWMNPDAMRDMRQECQLQSRRFQTPRKEIHANDSTSGFCSAAVSHGVAPRRPRIRPWVFYPVVVVDWHNYGYTILEQNRRPTTAVQLYKFLEVHLCAGNVNVTVSRAMRYSLEGFYPRLRPHTTVESPISSLSSLSSSIGHKKHHRASAEELEWLAPGEVTVLYDVAPAFFRPVSRRRCVRNVLSQVLLQQRSSTSPSTPPPTSNRTHPNSGTAAEGSYTLVSLSELESMGWGIAGPPSWVFADAAAEPSSQPESPSASLSSSSVFATPSAVATAATTPRKGVIMVGSTSWTEEDDYSLLLRALRRLDHRLNHEVSTYSSNNRTNNSSSGHMQSHEAPLDLWVLITGKGDTRKRFEDAVRAAKLSSHVVVSTYYAQSYQEYSTLLGAADVGLCLHFSSSGLDLPMKGVDMVGAGLPVVALQYPSIVELMGGTTRVLTQTRTAGSSTTGRSNLDGPAGLVECERGWVFQSDTDLEVLLSSFVGLPFGETTGSLVDDRAGRSSSGGAVLQAPTPLAFMKRKAQEARLHASTWEENWTRVLLPVLKQVV